MENKYWIGRNRSSIAMAHNALTAESRLIHYDLAGRYSIRAAQCVAFEQSALKSSTGDQRATLHLRQPGRPELVQEPLPQPDSEGRRSVDATMGEGR